MARTVVIKCNCKSKYQDEVYENNKRVANIKDNKADSTKYRCTVYGKEYDNVKKFN